MPAPDFSVYIIRCKDASFYTGIAVDVERRVAEHQSSRRGAKYLQGRGPLTVVFREIVGDRSLASKAEYRIKKLPRPEKEALINGRLSLVEILAEA